MSPLSHHSQNILLIRWYFATFFISAHPGAVKVVLVSSASEPPAQSPHTSEISIPADLDKTITELADWLVLIDQMLKSNIVTVGDVEEINKTISRMKVGAQGTGLSWQHLSKWVDTICLAPFCLS